MMDAGRHPNIDLLTCSELTSLSGKAGNFTATIRVNPRYVKQNDCVGCGECVEACPITVPNEFDLGLMPRKAIYRAFPQAVPSSFAISKRGTPPCTAGCPIHQNAQGYIALIGKGRYDEALEVILRENPLPSICGRVCTHPCMENCSRGKVDEPVNIPALKRFATEHSNNWTIKPPAKERKEKIAIVGSGPGGLMCAHVLRQKGYKPTIFESAKTAGGMLTVGIPSFRLPREKIAEDIQRLVKSGIEIKTGVTIGKDVTLEKLRKDYAAVFLAIGTHIERKLNVKGEDFKGVWGGIEFLRQVNAKGTAKIGKKVVVIGGGNSALDAARTARRCGAEVQIVYRRSRAEMPADPREIIEAEAEEIELTFLATPAEILGDEKSAVKGLKCVRMKLGEADASGRAVPVPISNSTFEIACDSVIVTIGQSADMETLGDKLGLQTTRLNTFEVNELTGETSLPGVFAGGDCVTGPDVVVNAMFGGKKAAISIDRYLRKRNLEKGREQEGPFRSLYEVDIEGVLMQKSIPAPVIEMKKRLKSFDEVHTGYTEEQAIAEAERCLQCGICCDCEQCVAACKREAIDHSMLPRDEVVNVGSVVVASGFEEFDPTSMGCFGGGRFLNVLTGLQFERLLAASGPTKGHVYRASDNCVPKSIVWVQCVGSRGEGGNDYCSRFCCMNAIKGAMLALEHEPSIEKLYMFYTDIRAFGKGFEEFVERAKQDKRIEFIRARPSKIVEDTESHDLTIFVETNGKSRKLTTDMVVLSTGAIPSESTKRLAEILKIDVKQDGFFATRDLSTTLIESTRSGVFVCGGSVGPEIIPEAVAQASGAASLAISYLSEESRLPEPEPVPEITDLDGPPRVGVFVCHCGANIGGTVDVEELAKEAALLPDVVYSGDELFACAQSSQRHIQEIIQEHNINRVVVAACTPRTHEPVYRAALAEIGLNPYLFEMANIRDQCTWVHAKDKQGAQIRARDQIRMAVARARQLVPLHSGKVPVEKRVLVVGGGISGVEAALAVARRGLPVELVESASELGGLLAKNQLNSLYPKGESAPEEMFRRVQALKLAGVEVHTNSTIQSISGFLGNFEVMIERAPTEHGGSTLKRIKCGAVILATGAGVYDPTGRFGYGEYKNVVTNLELERKFAEEEDIKIEGLSDKPQTAAFILCVGSRGDAGNPGCSSYCCPTTIKQALQLREQGIDVVVFYQDMRTVDAGMEELYREARGAGVLFIRVESHSQIQVRGESRAERIEAFDSLLGETVSLPVDLVVLAVGMIPREPQTTELQSLFKIPRGSDGFLLERHPELGPVETTADGVFICGTLQGPKGIAAATAQATAAAGKASISVGRDYVVLEPAIAEVNKALCRACSTCVDICPYHAISIQQENGNSFAMVTAAQCKGCGTCAAWCPTGAIRSNHFTDTQIGAMVDAVLEELSV
ncbi:FAD-dependent oxidoreductase [bacterium]|nr:FAD-dependent oxidoreductase [bacterium]